MSTSQRHIHIESGALHLDYQASSEQAQQVAEELARGFPGAQVTLTAEVPDGLPTLPCAQLWE